MTTPELETCGKCMITKEQAQAHKSAFQQSNAKTPAFVQTVSASVCMDYLNTIIALHERVERLRTPQGAAKVLLTISDVEIKPAAKALQDAFNLKGIGWKRYLSALRAAITALQVKP